MVVEWWFFLFSNVCYYCVILCGKGEDMKNICGVGFGFCWEMLKVFLFILLFEVDFWEVVFENWILFGGKY